MSSVGGGGEVLNPSLIPPQILEATKQGDYGQAAKEIKNSGSPFTEDQIISALAFLTINNVEISPNSIANLIAGEPVLPNPADIDVAKSMSNLVHETKSNPWFNENPMAVFALVFLEISYILSQAKLKEGLMAGDTILLQQALAKECAQLIRDTAQMQAMQDIVSGIMQLAGGVASIAGGAWGYKLGGDPANQGRAMGVNMGFQGVSQLFGALDSFSKAIFGIQIGDLNAQKQMTEQMQKFADHRLQSCMDEYKANGDLMNQMLQTLQQILEKEMQAHTWQK